MNKKKLEYYLEMARNEGANDTEIDDILKEHADTFITSEVLDDLTDKELQQIVDAYIEGYLRASL